MNLTTIEIPNNRRDDFMKSFSFELDKRLEEIKKEEDKPPLLKICYGKDGCD